MPKLPPPSATPKMQDHIFISYSSKDRAAIYQLVQKLREKGYIVWVDFDSIVSGESWRKAIIRGLRSSRVVLLALSPDSIQSEWVEKEIRAAIQLNKPIIPLLLRLLPEKILSKLLQNIIGHLQYHDFTANFPHAFDRLNEALSDKFKVSESSIHGYCAHVVNNLPRKSEHTWSLHYIQEQAKLLPIYASPYDEGFRKQTSENLLKQLWEGHRTIVLGEPGMGKSVAVERLAWELASAEPPIVPIIINLREYDGQPLLEWIRLTLIASDEPTIRHALRRPDTIEQYLHDTPFTFYILLDGLNEVPPDYRKIVLHEIRRLSLTFPRYPMVVTSRIKDESWRELRGGSFNATTLVVQSITEAQARAYLEAHLGVVEAAELWGRLDPRIRALTGTPLLLWLTKEAWLKTTGRLPGNRGELYASFIQNMLRRDDDRKLSNKIKNRDRLNALAKLALLMHQQKIVSIKEEVVENIVSDDILLETLMVNGLLRGEEIIRFAPHQTIQEHFAARAIRFIMKSNPQLEKRILDKAIDPWWAETFIQLAGISPNPNQLAQEIAKRNPWLAWWCVEEGQRVEARTRQIIERQSTRLVDSENVTDRRNAVQALLKLPNIRVIDQLAKLAVDVDSSVSEPANGQNN